MKKNAFTLVELLIVVAIIAVLVGAVMPYFESYVRDAKLNKAKFELDILKEALIKYETIEDKKFVGTDPIVLTGRYIQNVSFDPWGRGYVIDSDRGYVMSYGAEFNTAADDIIVDYKAPLTVQRASWVDGDNSLYISASDSIKLEFSRMLRPSSTNLVYSNSPSVAGDLLFSPEVKVGFLVATSTPASVSFLLIPLQAGCPSDVFVPGSSTVRIASGNDAIRDMSPNLFNPGGKPGRPANGTSGQPPGLEVTVKGN
jgi:prepilin-type N-terminal cleavage/methylation domain-containing protein